MTPRSNEEIWGDRAERAGSSFTRHPILWILGGIAFIVICSQVLAFGCGWYNAGKEIVSPTNVKAQYHFVIEDYVAMERQAENVCDAENTKTTEQSPTFLEDPAFALKAKYRQTETDYDKRQHNFFEAELVGPGGYPHTAPTLSQMEAKVC